MMVDWSDLPQELVISVANRIAFMDDFVNFGAVCKSWRSVATVESFTSRLTHQVPFCMLPEKNGIREFYDLAKDKIRKLDLPEARGKLCRSSLGWLLVFTVQNSECDQLHLSEFNLLHPLNRARIKLPEFKDSYGQFYLLKESSLNQIREAALRFALSSSPSWTSDYVVMVACDCRRLAFCGPRKDDHWTSTVLEQYSLFDLTYYERQFSVLCRDLRIYVCDIKDPKQTHARLVVPMMTWRLPYRPGCLFEGIYMVESAGDLLIVVLYSIGSKRGKPNRYKVFKVPFSNGDWGDSEVKDLGNKTFFLGRCSSSFSVDVTDHAACKANCIYYFSLSQFGVRYSGPPWYNLFVNGNVRGLYFIQGRRRN